MSTHDDAGRGRRTPVPSFSGLRSTSRAATRAMRGNRKRDTKPEILLRRALWHRGYRYRLHAEHLPGDPDLVFQRMRVAVFVDGDFWHGREWESRRQKLREGSNSAYWVAKIKRNRERDAEQTQALTRDGWTVVRLWESEVLDDPEAAADRVASTLSEAHLNE